MTTNLLIGQRSFRSYLENLDFEEVHLQRPMKDISTQKLSFYTTDNVKETKSLKDVFLLI